MDKIDIRKYIINNFKDCSKEEITESIEDSISSKEETLLPGLGVFFELIWTNELKEKIVDNLYKKIKG